MVKQFLKNIVPVSILSAVGVAVATQSAHLDAGPMCAPHNEPVVSSTKEQSDVDERIYYVGCGGLF